ncbi:saccharopine dehydrogenase [Nocardia panacis]|uniref:Saccharopine dehydrogenase n=2 Tax=Nocardia panacis TaxID=2340916 RepID=A0A3A4KZQ9_9NOCA|nr:saccharopine dehydrogenase [Nocardia panacis]
MLGGAGQMGRAAAATLARAPEVNRLVVTDLVAQRAVEFAKTLGPKAIGVGLDVTDAPALRAALAECDLVLNTVGPFFRFGAPILAAAIEVGRDYIDICDDWEPTLAMLAMDEKACAAGTVALVGMGSSPGVANLLALLAARELDTVDSLITAWSGEDAPEPVSDSDGPSAAYVHAVHQISGSIRVRRNGFPVDRRALERIVIDYPGIGAGVGYSFGHPEAVTLDRALPGLRNNTNVMLGGPTLITVGRTLRWLVARGVLTADRAAAVAERTLGLLPATSPLRPGSLPPLFALATGSRAGERASAATALAQVPGASMAENTGIPLAVAALQLLRADSVPQARRRPGVHTPETLIDPAEFFAAFAPHCIGAPPAAAMTVTTRSWSSAEENATCLRTSLLTAFLAAGTVG